MNKPEKLHWGFWATLGFSLLVFIAFSIVQSIALIAFALSQNNWKADNDFEQVIASLTLNGDAISLSEIPSAFIGIALIALFASLRPHLSATQYLELYFPKAKTLLKWIGIMILAMILLEVANHVFERETPEFMSKVYNSATNLPLLWFAIIIAAPFFEEYLFRGFLFEGLRNSFVGTVGAILITSASWAIIHLQYEWFEIFTIFLIGILLAIAKLKTRSLYVPITMHALMNLVATILMAFLIENPATMPYPG